LPLAIWLGHGQGGQPTVFYFDVCIEIISAHW
jgi:hypothetical protein